jgi:hypothetical protein
MATFSEPPPLASVAAVIGFGVLSLAIGLSGKPRESNLDQSGSAQTSSRGEPLNPTDGDGVTSVEGHPTRSASSRVSVPDDGAGGHE